jgi:hypothetical protein
MRGRDLDLSEEIGLTLFERKSLATLMVQGMADAAVLWLLLKRMGLLYQRWFTELD